MNGKRVMRITGTLLLAAGVAMLVWVLVVWRWQDPFTALYTTWKQHQLSQSYSDRAEAFRLPEPKSKTAAARVVTAGQIKLRDNVPVKVAAAKGSDSGLTAIMLQLTDLTVAPIAPGPSR